MVDIDTSKSTAVKISVVIPVYNNALSAGLAVCSVIRQSCPVHEIILVDDASHAKCSQMLMRWLATCQGAIPVRILPLRENVGPGYARHCGAQSATGDYVAFLDADDVWHERKVEEVVRLIRIEGADLLGHERPWSFKLPKSALKSVGRNQKHRTLTRADFLKRNPIPTSSIVVANKIAKRMFRYGGRKSEDYMALLIANREAKRTVFLDAPLCWARKPPFGHSGEGADQTAIYKASVDHVRHLRREGILSARDVAIFLTWLAIRVPIGMVRQGRYRTLSPAPLAEEAKFERP